MSEIGWIGRAFRVVLNGTVIAAVRTKSVGMATEQIDVTEGEQDGWRRLLGVGDSHSVDLNVDGVTTTGNFQVMMSEWYGNEFSDVEIWHPNGSVQRAVDGAFLRALEFSGESRGHVAFTASMSFSGLVYLVPPIVLTSRPYPIEEIDGLLVGVDMMGGSPSVQSMDSLDVGMDVLEGTLVALVFILYEDWPPESLDVGVDLLGGTIVEIITIPYEDWPPESLDVEADLLGGTLDTVLVFYTDWPPESLDVGVNLIGGTLV